MRVKPCLFVAWAACSILLAAAPSLAQANPIAQTKQVLLVLADNWDSRQGWMRLYERTPGRAWQAVGALFPVMLGKNGLGWGIGVHEGLGAGPVKQEGDGKAPAGIFRLGNAFGYDPPKKHKLKIPYRQMTGTFECVDDPASPHYNHVLDASTVASRDWGSSEMMLRPDSEYSLGVVVEHNRPPAAPGAGSCIFLHVWSAPGAYTSGCTAMAEKNMERVAAWLDPGKKPLLVQLPKGEHGRFKELYGLP